MCRGLAVEISVSNMETLADMCLSTFYIEEKDTIILYFRECRAEDVSPHGTATSPIRDGASEPELIKKFATTCVKF